MIPKFETSLPNFEAMVQKFRTEAMRLSDFHDDCDHGYRLHSTTQQLCKMLTVWVWLEIVDSAFGDGFILRTSKRSDHNLAGGYIFSNCPPCCGMILKLTNWVQLYAGAILGPFWGRCDSPGPCCSMGPSCWHALFSGTSQVRGCGATGVFFRGS